MSFQLSRLSAFLQTNGRSLADTLRILGHFDRFQVVALLVERDQTFAELAERTGLSKTALSNHLNQLSATDLVVKYERGSYTISRDGIELMEHLGIFYRSKQDRQLVDLRGAYLHYQHYPIVEEVVMKMNKLQTQPKFLPAWHSYLGAIGGVIQTMNPDLDLTDLAGFSGMAFLINIAEKETHIASTTAHSDWEQVHAGTELLGFKVDGYWDEGHIFGNQELSATDVKRLKDLWEYVKANIDDGKAVVVWGLGIAEFGIVYGYDDEHYLVSTVRQMMNVEDNPIHYTRLTSPGGLWAYTITPTKASPNEDTHKTVILTALAIAKGQPGGDKVGTAAEDGWKSEEIRYGSGPFAYDYWIRAFEDKQVEPRGNAYNAASWHESRIYAVKFFERLYETYHDRDFSEQLQELANIYGQIKDRFENLESLFPMHPVAKADPSDFGQAITLLKEAKQYESKAIDQLELLTKAWT